MSGLTNVNLMVDFLDIKRCRETLCKNYIEENPIISESIIEYWNLSRVDQKYRQMCRMFDENSYSKRKIKAEETIFCRKHMVLQPLRYYFEEQRILNDTLFIGLELHQNYVVDEKIYRKSVISGENDYDYPKHPFIIKKNNRARFDLSMKVLETPEIRERCIREYLNRYNQFVCFLITNYNLKFTKYKHIDKTISPYESSYTRHKIKLEELFLINKIYQYAVWFRRMEVYWDLQRGMLNEQLIEQESKDMKANMLFVEYIVDGIIEHYRDVDFKLDEDINLN